MRRLIAAAVLGAAAFAPAASAACTPTRAGVCVSVDTCLHCGDPRIVVDPYCVPQHPVIQPCATIDGIYIDVFELLAPR